mgnify:CR=1 FL=1
MKKLTVIVKPANREDVIDIMESCAVYGVMETDITGYGNQKGYRGDVPWNHERTECTDEMQIRDRR